MSPLLRKALGVEKEDERDDPRPKVSKSYRARARALAVALVPPAAALLLVRTLFGLLPSGRDGVAGSYEFREVAGGAEAVRSAAPASGVLDAVWRVVGAAGGFVAIAAAGFVAWKLWPVLRASWPEAVRKDRMRYLASHVPVAAWDCGLRTRADRTLIVSEAVEKPEGFDVLTKLPAGLAVGDVVSRAEHLAAALGVHRLYVTPHERRADLLTISVRSGDALAAPVAVPWPVAGVWDVAHPVPVAVTETGEIVTADLWQSSVLLAGSPGSGKSVAMWLLVLAAALDPSVTLLVVDAKGGVEFSLLRSRADHLAINAGEAVSLLTDVLTEVERRTAWLVEQGRRKTERDDTAFPPIVLVVDEMAEVTGLPSKESKEAAGLLRRIVALGRAVGITVIGATQKPSADVVPTGLRDIFRYRWGFRCGTRGQAETVLGGSDVAGDLVDIPAGSPGVGYLVTEAGDAVRCRAWFADDDLVTRLVAESIPPRDEALRTGAGSPWVPSTVEGAQ